MHLLILFRLIKLCSFSFLCILLGLLFLSLTIVFFITATTQVVFAGHFKPFPLSLKCVYLLLVHNPFVSAYCCLYYPLASFLIDLCLALLISLPQSIVELLVMGFHQLNLTHHWVFLYYALLS